VPLAKPSPESAQRPRLLVLELWGLGDLVLSLPFLKTAASNYDVALVAKPVAAPLLRRFTPEVQLIPFTAPWTKFTNKYQVLRWPWGDLFRIVRAMRREHAVVGVSARRDPRDHFLLRISGAKQRMGFARAGSKFLLTEPLSQPASPHRATHWVALADALGLKVPHLPALKAISASKQIVIHTGAGHPVREWPRERFEELGRRLRADGWSVELIDNSLGELDALTAKLAPACCFIGNDSGPGHLAAFVGVPTFTIFGPQLPELFAPRHPQADWIEGAPCPFKPCFDRCRFPTPFCLTSVSVDMVLPRVRNWLKTIQS